MLEKKAADEAKRKADREATIKNPLKAKAFETKSDITDPVNKEKTMS